MAIKRGFIRHIGAGNSPIRSSVLSNVSSICCFMADWCYSIFVDHPAATLPYHPGPCLLCNYVLQLNFLPLRIIAPRHSKHRLILIKRILIFN